VNFLAAPELVGCGLAKFAPTEKTAGNAAVRGLAFSRAVHAPETNSAPMAGS